MFTALYFVSVCLSTPFERYRSFTSPSKRAADSQNFWHLSNTDASVYVHQWAISPALRWRSSEREKNLSNRLAASSFFQNFRPVDLRSPTELSHYPDRSLIEATCTLRMTCPVNNGNVGQGWIARFPRRARFNACTHETHLEKEQVRETICGGLAKLLAPQKRESFSVDLPDPRQSMRKGFHLMPL